MGAETGRLEGKPPHGSGEKRNVREGGSNGGEENEIFLKIGKGYRIVIDFDRKKWYS